LGTILRGGWQAATTCFLRMACSGIPHLTSEVGENFVNQLQCAVLDRDPTFDRYAEHKDVVNRHNNLVLLPSRISFSEGCGDFKSYCVDVSISIRKLWNCTVHT
jgi:hypothetical protein